MKLVSWNVAGRTKGAREQATALMREEPDLVGLQEIRPAAIDIWRSVLAEHGIEHAEETTARLDGRANAVLIASRWPIAPMQPVAMPQPERFLSVRVEHPMGDFELHAAHVPSANAYGLIKVETFEAIHAALANDSELPRILCGDFNSPMLETDDGETLTFADRHPDNWELFDAAERSVIVGLKPFDLPDLFRELNGWKRKEYSWIHEQSGRGVRLDHVFASRRLNPTACDYIHSFRTDGLSDHSAIWASFAPARRDVAPG